MNMPDKKALLVAALMKKKGMSSLDPPAILDDITRVDRNLVKQHPLSYAQEQIWFQDKLVPNSPVYNIPIACKIIGNLDLGILEHSISQVVYLNEALRTKFSQTTSTPYCFVEENLPIKLEVRTEFLSSKDNEQEILADLVRTVRKPFDLESERLIRATIWHCSENEFYLLVLVHHIIFDGWSVSILQREISDQYNRLAHSNMPEVSKGKKSTQSDKNKIGYIDFSVWQRELHEKSDASDQIKYWKNKLAGELQVLELPTDRPRPKLSSFNGAIEKFSLPQSLHDNLATFANRMDVTVYMVLISIFNMIINRYSSNEDIFVGTPVSNRDNIKLENIIGFFVNTLVLRSDLSSNIPFNKYVLKTKNAVLEAFENQNVPLARIVDELNVERDLSHNPLFQVMFSYQNLPASTFNFNGTSVKNLPTDVIHTGSSKVDMNFVVETVNQGTDIFVEYSTDLFEACSIVDFARNYINLLRETIEDPSKPLHDISMLSEIEEAQFREWNKTNENLDFTSSLLTKFEIISTENPDLIALEFGTLCLTYAELNKRANKCAAMLIDEGISIGDFVGIYMERSIDMVVAIYGVLKAGAVYIPIDPDYPEDRTNYIISDAKLDVVLCHAKLVSASLNVGNFVDIGLLEEYQPNLSELKLPEISVGEIAYVIYTSGTTGNPKGVLISHRSIVSRLEWMQKEFYLDNSDIVLQKTPYAFDVSVWELFWPLMFGAKMLIAKPNGHKDTGYLKDLIALKGVTTTHFVPSMLNAFLETESFSECGSLRRVFCSGEALRYETVDRFMSDCDAELHNLYGPTEASIDVTHWKCVRNEEKLVPIGKPISNTQLYVLDKFLARKPVGAIGELYIAGIQVANGYLNKPDLTLKQFVPNIYSSDENEKMYRTGDLVRFLRDGNIEYIGRTDFQVKVRGFRIELGEIETAINKSKEIYQCVVVVKSDAANQESLIAYFVTKDDDIISITNIRKAIRAILPSYMIPQVFVELDEIPLTANGKIDRVALPDPIGSRLSGISFVPPETESELSLAKIWSQILNVEAIGRYDNFFEIGGNSLLSISVVSSIKKQYAVEIELRAMVMDNLHQIAAAYPHFDKREQIRPITKKTHLWSKGMKKLMRVFGRNKK